MIALIPRGRMKTIALGLTLGVLVSAVSWLESLRGMESHVVSAFPHVLILIVLPVCLFGVLWQVYRTSDTCPYWATLTRALLRDILALPLAAIDAALGHRLTGPPLRHSWPLTLPKLSITSMGAVDGLILTSGHPSLAT